MAWGSRSKGEERRRGKKRGSHERSGTTPARCGSARARVWTVAVGRTSGAAAPRGGLRANGGATGLAAAAAATKQHRVDFLQFEKRHPSFTGNFHPENLDTNTHLPSTFQYPHPYQLSTSNAAKVMLFLLFIPSKREMHYEDLTSITSILGMSGAAVEHAA